jgi:hypothetical protein
LQTDGKIVVAGSSSQSSPDFTVARYLGGAGSNLVENNLFIRSLNLFPNPAKDYISLNYYLQERSNITIKLTDLQGRVISTLLDNVVQDEGSHSIYFNLKNDLATGSYFIIFETNNGSTSMKLQR